MQFLNEVNRPHIIDSVSAPMVFTHFWTFSGHAMDFMLEPMTYLEETTGPTVTIEIEGMNIEVPASWFIIAVDKETWTVDSVPIATAAAHEHHALLFSAEDSKANTASLRVVNFTKKAAVYHPAIPKGSAMVHPCSVGEKHGRQAYYGVMVGPHELHRYLGGKTVGDLLT